ncbi:MAG: molybdopterin cofactor-binding domain-containing protein [Gammaproteobacteria bacterium]
MSTALGRRAFLQASLAAAGSLAFDLRVVAHAAGGDAAVDLHHWIVVHPDDRVTVRIPQSEIGQGATTALMQVIAEELELDLTLTDWAFYDPQTNVSHGNVYVHTSTLASWGVKMLFEPMRTAGARIRTLLVACAAEELGVATDQLAIDRHTVRHAASGRALGFGALAEAAAAHPLPDASTITLKPAQAWRYIGQACDRNDIHDKVTGAAQYGIDVSLPGMTYAAVRQAPVFGGRLRGFDASAVQNMPGVRAVVRIDAGPSGYTVPPTLWDVIDWQMDDAVAVVADSWWQAERALAALPIEWDDGPHADADSAGIAQALADALDAEGELVRSEGDARTALAARARVLEAEYHYPFVEHAPMEPMNCTARVEGRTVEAWAPTQYGDEALRIAAYAAGVALKDARFHLTLAGGGFGRRLHNDYVSQAVQIARQLPGTPVKLIVSREESLRRSYYPPPLAARLRAGLDGDGRLVAWSSHVVQGTAVEQPYGFSRLAYPVANVEMRYGSIVTPPGFAWMRGVGHTQMAWMNHGFLSEIAAALGRDTREFLLALLDAEAIDTARPDHADATARVRRYHRLLEAVAAQAGARPDDTGRGRGYAVYDMSYVPGYRNSCIAIACDVTLDGRGGLRVDDVHAAVECGVVVNPQIVEQQIQGGVLFGLSNALHGKITLKHGRVEQSNFHDYPLLGLARAPAVHVHVLPSDEAPTGIGEGAVPVVIGALVDAIWAAGGPRIRALPVLDHDLRPRGSA